MKKYLETIVIVTIMVAICSGQSSESYKYIWAQGGINLRERPAANSRILSKLPFGDSLVILNTTDIGLSYLLIKTGKDKQRLLLQSRWVKVLVNNVSGYMIDGYLLDYPCPKKDETLVDFLDRLRIKDKTEDIEVPFKLNFGIARFECKRMDFTEGHKVSFKNENYMNEVYNDFISAKGYYLGFSSSILIVFLDPFYDILKRDGLKIKVSTNWEKYLNIWDENVDDLDFALLDNGDIIMD